MFYVFINEKVTQNSILNLKRFCINNYNLIFLKPYKFATTVAAAYKLQMKVMFSQYVAKLKLEIVSYLLHKHSSTV